MVANGQPNQEIPYEKLANGLGNSVLLIQGHLYSLRKPLSQSYYSCVMCNKSMVYLENDVVVKEKSVFKHSKNHGPPSDAEVKKYRYHHAKHEYFKDRKNFKKSGHVIYQEILEKYSLDSLGFSSEVDFYKTICWYLQNQQIAKRQKRRYLEIFGKENEPEILNERESENESNQAIEMQPEPTNGKESENDTENTDQIKTEENLPQNDLPAENFNEVPSENSNDNSSEVPSENPNEIPIQFNNSMAAKIIEKLKFFIKEINELLLPSNDSSSKLLSIKNFNDVKFYLSKVKTLLIKNNCNNQYKDIKFFILEISELLDGNDEGLVSIKDFEEIKFYMKKINKLMEENVNDMNDKNVQNDSIERKPKLGSSEMPISIDYNCCYNF